MTRLLPILFVPFVAIPLIAAPVPRHLFPKDPPLYFPTKVGTKWVYAEDEGEKTLVVEAVEPGRGGLVVTVARVDGEKRTPYEKVAVSPGGLVRLEMHGEKLDPPLVLLKAPPKAGDAWDLETRLTEGPAGVLTMTVAGEEDVTVPAGRFTAARVDCAYLSPEHEATCTRWYALGVGLVQAGHGGRAYRSLKSFAPGKD